MMEFESDILRCLDTLARGGVILYPTDTVWGLGCDATNPTSIQRIGKLKDRPSDRSFIILVTEEQDILKHVASPDLALFDYLKSCPKPTTVIYDGAIGLADNLLASDGSVAIRICHDPFCRHMIKRFGKPIVSTSANRHGQPTPGSFKDIDPLIREGADYVVNHRQSESEEYQASTLMRWENGYPRIIRP